jgi:hypothetical protein
MSFLLTLLLLAAPYWETKSPAEWTDVEVSQLLSNSPWAQAMKVSVSAKENLPAVQVYLATAHPLQLAEQERDRRAKLRSSKGKDNSYDAFAEEYRAWLEDYSKDHIILAIRVGNAKAYSESKELSALKNSAMKIGRRKIPLTSYFPPSARDPYLRVAFPRIVQLSDKKVQFELYIPGIAGPFRGAEFDLDQMVVGGKLEL